MNLITLLTSLLARAPDNQLDNALFDKLIHGDWWDAITGVFTSTIGELFFAILFLLGPALLYIKTQDVVPSALAVVGTGAVLAGLFTSPIRFFFAVCAIIGVAVVLWQVAHK